MFKNYFLTAYRNLLRHKGFSLLNIAGLTLGLTACLLIGLFVYDEFQYDKFLPDSDRIYRIYNIESGRAAGAMVAPVPPMFATTFAHDIPETDQAMRILMQPLDIKNLVETGGKKLYETGLMIADPNFFDIFQLSFMYGSPAKVLDEMTSVVISDAFSERVFGNIDPVGKEVTINKETKVVKGVFRTNKWFHLPVNFVVPIASQLSAKHMERMKSWGWNQFFTYVKLKEGADPQVAQSKLKQVAIKQIDDDTNKPYDYLPVLQPLKEVHLYSAGFVYDAAIRGNITYVKALGLIAVFILLIACFNFVNLATAKSVQRAREVGVRKAIGAGRSQLIVQFLGETIFLTFISVIFSAVLTCLLLPALNGFTGKEMRFNIIADPLLILLLLVLTAVVGVLAGFYPALMLSGFRPVRVLKSAMPGSGKMGSIQRLRQGLIVVQFAASVFLIISAVIVFKQVSFLHNTDLGFNKEQIMFFQLRGENMEKNFTAFKNELKKGPGIKNVTIGYGFPGDATAGDHIIVLKNGEQVHHSATFLMTDFDYMPTLDVKLVAGRAFSEDYRTDEKKAFIINETAVKEFGYETPEKALGQTLLWPRWDADSLKEGKIIGVAKDFHFKSLYDKVDPAVLQIYPKINFKVAVKMDPAAIGASIEHVKDVWAGFSPDYPVEYIFMDENFTKMYTSEDKLKTLLLLFTGIAIFVACLGLFGLAAFTAERRRKEIGIRKVLGANTASIVDLLSREFIILVGLAALIAFPAAWLAMQSWLQNFAYRIDIPVWVFAAAFLITATVALFTVGLQAVKAAKANPVKNLRFE